LTIRLKNDVCRLTEVLTLHKWVVVVARVHIDLLVLTLAIENVLVFLVLWRVDSMTACILLLLLRLCLHLQLMYLLLSIIVPAEFL
jgi:hypothetical protein